MTIFLTLIWIAACCFAMWSVLSMIWRKGMRKKLKRRFIVFFALGCGLLVGIGYSADRDARLAGFESADDQRRAEKAGINDPAAWLGVKQRNSEDLAKRLANEAEATRQADIERQARADADARAVQVAADAQRLKDDEDRKQKEAACRSDIRCWGEEHWSAASVKCPAVIERLAKWDFEWTDGWTEPKMARYRWKNQETGIVTYIGDKLKLQNGFGAWKHVTYTCDFDTITRTVVDASAS